MQAQSALRQRFIAAAENQQYALLRQYRGRLQARNISIGEVANRPVAIEQIEWFQSPFDTARLLRNLWKSNDPVVRQILAIGPGIGPGDRLRWRYLGYKGGSEPGVVNMSFLVQSKRGQWYAVSGSWNNTTQNVDKNQFTALMTRLLNQLAEN